MHLQLWIKRLADATVSSLLLVMPSPLFGIVALAIRLDSTGTVFFNRVRVGKDGHEFAMFRFRTMVLDAEGRLAELQQLNEGGPHMIKITDDPRVTRVRRILQASSADELPQLVNVTLGDMSLVGPRPHAPMKLHCIRLTTARGC